MKRVRGACRAITAVHFRAEKEAFGLHRQTSQLSYQDVGTLFEAKNMTPTTHMRVVLVDTNMLLTLRNAALVPARVALPECGFSEPKFNNIDAFEWKGRKVKKTFKNKITYHGEIVDFVECRGSEWKCVVHFEDNEVLECKFHELCMVAAETQTLIILPSLCLLSTTAENAFQNNILPQLKHFRSVH
jgi:hypothetical protein